MSRPLQFVSLFTGVGGFDLGLEAAGWQCVAQVEWNRPCQQVLCHHWPNVPKWSDIADVRGTDLPACDVVVFGSPCQDLSVAGKRAGFEGDRSVLFFEAVRVIREIREASHGRGPSWVVWENVPGALSSSSGRDFAAVLGNLAELGAMDIAWRVLDARFFGVPQRRRRVFVVADFAGQRAGSLFVESEGMRRDSSARRSTLGQASGGAQGVVDAKGVSDLVIAFGHTQGINPQASSKASPTLRANGSGAAVLDMSDGSLLRRMTPVECERLNGWPDDHTRYGVNAAGFRVEQSDSARYKQIGNGVASPVAEWIAQQINATVEGM